MLAGPSCWTWPWMSERRNVLKVDGVSALPLWLRGGAHSGVHEFTLGGVETLIDRLVRDGAAV